MYKKQRVKLSMATTRGVAIPIALAELKAVLWAWVCGEGDLIGLLVAWWQVVSGTMEQFG